MGEGTGAQGAPAIVPQLTTELILSASPARLTNNPCRRHLRPVVGGLDVMPCAAAEAARTATLLGRATPLNRNCRAVIRSPT